MADRDRLAKSLDALNFMYGLGGEIRLSTTRARPHGNSFDNQQSGALAKAEGNVLQLHGGAAAARAVAFSRGRQ